MVREAAFDPAVQSIKITIYRLASRAKLAEYLCRRRRERQGRHRPDGAAGPL